MFERFNEDARRALFFSRYVATQVGAVAISPSHLAAGVLRETSADTWAALGGAQSLEHVREFLKRGAPATNVQPAVEIPFTTETKVALTRAAEIADQHNHQVISPMHLLAGVMAVDRDDAARILRQAGLDPQKVAAAGGTDEPLPRFTPHVEARLVEASPNAAGPALLSLLDERALERLCNELFAATDRKDWNAARGVFVDGSMLVDMTSLAGGAPAYMTADDLVAGFRQGLHRDKVSHH